MNDLNGLNWSTNPTKGQRPPNYNNAFSSLRPTAPATGRTSPLSSSTSPKPPSKPATPANDSFSNLVSFSTSTTNKNLSLQEQQKRLAESKVKQAGSTSYNHFAAVDDTFWNNLGSGRSTPQPPQQTEPQKVGVEQDDFLAAFAAPRPKTSTPSNVQSSFKVSEPLPDDDDDPFGLSEFQAKQRSQQQVQPRQEIVVEDDDVLGLLGKPISERPVSSKKHSPEPEFPNVHPKDKAIAELVDMGFPAPKARQALETTDSGTDVQAAVGWLLTQAHSEAQSRSRGRNNDSHDVDRPSRSRPAREEPITTQPERRSGTPSNDPAKIASDLSANFLKTAGSLWKQGQKKVQQAVQEFNSDSDSSQPKWMREPTTETKPQRRSEKPMDGRRRRRSSAEKQAGTATEEAMMLEGSRPEQPPRQPQRSRRDMMFDSSADNSRDHSPAMPSRLRESYAAQPPASRARPQPAVAPKPNLSRQAAEEQAATAYVSSARRRKPATAPAPSFEDESNLLEQTSKPIAAPRTTASQPLARPVISTPIVTRPPAPMRTIPSVSAIALRASHADREKGNEHFKKGDYASAHQSYTKSLSHLPTAHPITIILLTNRALTALKTGEPKTAIADSDTAIQCIGQAKGESETVDLTNGDPAKPMRDYYGKALMRKAEALEQMEKWAEAASVWKEAVEGGHGGATSIQARMRAEKAANPGAAKPKPVAARKPAPRAVTRPNVSTPGVQAEAAAVSRLRAQNAAAEKADDEKFALADSVGAKITAWKGGKADNLRALLGSLDTVLWPEAGWKKISMADLVLPNKVKIQYMKGIAKVHPDKIPTDASTEQRMIAGSVFSTLNEAWDKFKKENGL